MTHHGLSWRNHDARTRQWRKAGMKQVWLQRFRDKSGAYHYQTTWIGYR